VDSGTVEGYFGDVFSVSSYRNDLVTLNGLDRRIEEDLRTCEQAPRLEVRIPNSKSNKKDNAANADVF